jgi:hypothetical protein
VAEVDQVGQMPVITRMRLSRTANGWANMRNSWFFPLRSSLGPPPTGDSGGSTAPHTPLCQNRHTPTMRNHSSFTLREPTSTTRCNDYVQLVYIASIEYVTWVHIFTGCVES